MSYASVRGHAAAYFAQTDVLAALDTVDRAPDSPVSMSIVSRPEHRTET